MTDRELLEAAAKAAGIEWRRDLDPTGMPLHLDLSADGGDDCWPWTPLTDDGDALRLMGSLELVPEYGSGLVRVFIPKNWFPDDAQFRCTERYDDLFGPTFFSALRRAIVRAAAAIGGAVEAQTPKARDE
jgi:hypothetical protein